MENIKFGICYWSFPLEGPYACKIASQLGLQAIELDLGDYERNFPLSNRIIQDAYLEAAEKWEISYPAIAVNALCNYGMTNTADTLKGEVARLAIKKAVEVAQSMRIPVVQVPSFFDGEIKDEKGLMDTVTCLKFACRYAADRGVTIATENVLSVEESKRLLEEVSFQNIKIYFDLQNYYNFKGYSVPDVLSELFPYICEVHAKDGKTGELSGALLGEGDADFAGSVKVLKKLGYSGWIHLENYYDRAPLNRGDSDPFELLKYDIATLKNSFE
jgi:sugar phosphate isomerase/epimerase